MTREEQIEEAAISRFAGFGDLVFEFIYGANWADENPNWHKYPEETPEPEKPVLCYTAKGTYVVAWQREKLIGGKPSGKYEWSRWNVPIIAWMELPEPPKFD